MVALRASGRHPCWARWALVSERTLADGSGAASAVGPARATGRVASAAVPPAIDQRDSAVREERAARERVAAGRPGERGGALWFAMAIPCRSRVRHDTITEGASASGHPE